MKQFSRNVSLVLMASLLGAGSALAQGLIQPKSGPAEYPPSSYSGKQYVDSKGCVFIRAGFDGQTSWVPRMARNRTPVCGFQPTQVAGATSTPPAAPRANATQITAAVPETGAPAAAAPVRTAAAPSVTVAPQRGTVRLAQPRAAAPVVVTAASVAGPASRVTPRYEAPKIRVPEAPVAEAVPRAVAPAYAAPRVVTGVATPCNGMSSVGQQYLTRGTGSLPVRCGPQSGYSPYAGGAAPVAAAPRVVSPSYTAPRYAAAGLPSYEKRAPVATGPKVFAVPNQPVKRVVQGQRTTQAYVSPQARVLPKPVYQERLLSQDVQVPKGYRQVWDDDRLNPRRAEQTLAGKRQMEMVWTQTVPRKLVPVEVAPQAVTGQVVRRQPAYFPTAQGSTPRYAQPRLSTRSAPAVAPSSQKAPLVGRFVQVGSFRSPGNAQATAQRLAAAGLPVQIRRSGSGQIVMAGPFNSDRAVGNAVSAARRAGFPGAFPRN